MRRPHRIPIFSSPPMLARHFAMLRMALLAHPHLSGLMTFDDRELIVAYEQLLIVLIAAGVSLAEVFENTIRWAVLGIQADVT